MKIEKTELTNFEIPDGDSVSLWVQIKKDKPRYLVLFNKDQIGDNDEHFPRADSLFENIRKVLRLQNNILYCAYCDDYIVGTKEYQLSEGYKESLCPKCHIKAKVEYKTVIEVKAANKE